MKNTILTIILLLSTNMAFANELEDRKAIQNKVEALFNNGQYKALDKLELKYRKNKSRTKSGFWKLELFYSVFNTANENKDPMFWQNNFRRLSEWMEQNPKSVAVHIAYAKIYTQYAWEGRGNEYANNTNQIFLRVFQNNLNIAAEHLDKHKKQSSVTPAWYAQKISSMTGLPNSKEQFVKVFNEGVAKFPDYTNIYLNASKYLAPRWHGSETAINDMANQSIALTKKTDGMGMYARIYWYADTFQYTSAPYSQETWKKIKLGIDDVLKQYPTQWNIQNLAFLACKAKDAKTTIKLMKKIEKPIILDELKVPANYNYCNSLF